MLNFFPGQKYGVAVERLDCVSPFHAPLLPETGADPDGDGGDSPSPEGDANDETTGQDAAAEPAGHAEDSLEDLLAEGDDDDDEADPSKTRSPREAKLAKKNRRYRRQLAKLHPLAARIKDLDLDELIATKRQYEQLRASAEANPRLRALLNGDAADEPQPKAKTKAETPPADDFDESTLPFDPTENSINRYFADMAKTNHTLLKTVKELTARLDSRDGKEAADAVTSERTQWKSAIDAAAGQLPKTMQAVFRDAMGGAYATRQRHGRTPQQVVAHYMKELGISETAANKANAAAAATAKPGATPADRQRIAENNRTQPRTVAPQGQPSTARPARELLSDVRKRLALAR